MIVGLLYTYRKNKLLEYKALFCPSFKVTEDVQGPCMTCIYWLDRKIIIEAEKYKDKF